MSLLVRVIQSAVRITNVCSRQPSRTFLVSGAHRVSYPTVCKAVTVKQCSDDLYNAVTIVESPLPDIKEDEVLGKILAAPVNPSDLIKIAGMVEYTFNLPFVVGFEGVGEIIKVGAHVKKISPGDWFLPRNIDYGTWRDYGVYHQRNVLKIDKSLGLEAAATFMVNPHSAYCLLDDFPLKRGDTIIQNVANSYMGKCLIQLARHKGLRSINIVRDRPDIEHLIKELKDLGADEVYTDKEMETMKLDVEPVLGIDCIGGEAAAMLIKHIGYGGTLINHGLLSGQVIPVNPVDLIFRQIKIRGFLIMPTLMNEHRKLVDEVIPFYRKLMEAGEFRFPEFDLYPFSEYKACMAKLKAGFSNKKQILVMEPSLIK